MSKQILILTVIVFGGLSCTLNVSDSNPKAASVFGTGDFAPSINNGNLVLSGSGLNNVTSIKIGANKENLSIANKSASLLVAALPAALTLPSLLFVSTANAEEQISLAALGTLSVDGTLTVTGKANLGFVRESAFCANTNNPCPVTCSAGKVAVSGGCSTNNVPLTLNYPVSDNQWTCRTSTNANVEAWVICANVNIN